MDPVPAAQVDAVVIVIVIVIVWTVVVTATHLGALAIRAWGRRSCRNPSLGRDTAVAAGDRCSFERQPRVR